MSTQPLHGKSALVTGGARRIGREIALALARAGADVAITYRTSHTEAAQTAREIETLGCRALAVECDVRSEASVRCAIAATTTRFGTLDILVNNAAVFESAALDRISLEQWDTVFETNTRGPFLVARSNRAFARGSRKDHQHWLPGWNPCMGTPCALLRFEGGTAHANSSDGQGIRARSERQLRSARLD